MAYLKQAKTEDDIKKITVSNLRKEYLTLATDYNKILDLDIVFCHKCNTFLTNKMFYPSKDYVSGYYPICKKCLMGMACDYDKKTGVYTDNKKKAMHVLQMMDLPFIESLYDKAVEGNKAQVNERNMSTAWQAYKTVISSLPQYVNLKWENSEYDATSDDVSSSNRKPRKEIIKIFGRGFSDDDYLYLQDQYDDWKARTQVDSKSQETYIIRICFKLLDIWKAQKSGRDTKDLDKSLNELMAAANLQPKQNVANSANDTLTFGQMIEKWEAEKPIPEPSPEFRDVDGIKKYISVWFKGALCSALGIGNTYSQEYEDEVKKYTVEKPTEREDDVSGDIYSTIFGKQEQ